MLDGGGVSVCQLASTGLFLFKVHICVPLSYGRDIGIPSLKFIRVTTAPYCIQQASLDSTIFIFTSS
jgi:hypothetical protein